MCYLFSFLCVWHISINKLSEVWIFSQYLKHDRYPVDFRVLKVLLEPFVLHPHRLSPFHGRVIISRSLSIQLLGSGGGLFLYLSHIWDVDSWLLLYFLQNISEKGCTGDKIFEIFFRSGNSLLVTSSHLLLGKIEGRGRSGWQKMRRLDGIKNSMDVGLSKLQEMVKGREAWHAAVHVVRKTQTWLTDWTTSNSNIFNWSFDWV